MKITGSSHLTAERDSVYAALNDPAVLVRTIPGCTRLEAVGDDAYDMTISAGVASVKGVYQGQVRLSDQDGPASFRLHAKGAGAPGTIGADVLVELSAGPDGGTDLTYDADAVVGGMIGGVGQRMLTGVSKKMAAEFFANVEAVLTGAEPAAPQVGPGEPQVEPAETGVFTAPAPSRSAGLLGANGFAAGAAVGAAAALVGALVGARIARRR